ncbi:MAG: tetratricopeptide repeat protein [Acidobacteriota bacterium]
MSDVHVNTELLQAITRGEIHPSALVELIVEHLLEICPACRSEIEAWRENPTGEVPNYEGIFDRLISHAKTHEGQVAEERQVVERDFADLLAMEPTEREGKILRAHKRFRGHMLADRLLAKSSEGLPADLHNAQHFADLAVLVACRSEPSTFTTEVHVRALAHQANARRAQGDLPEADSLFKQARALMRAKGITDKLVYAEVDFFEGSLKTDQRKFRQADMMLRRATLHYRLARDNRRVAESLVKLGNLHYFQQNFDQSIDAFREALRSCRPADNPRLVAAITSNLATVQTEAGLLDEAQETLARAKSLGRHFTDGAMQRRLTWLEGKVARETGDSENAEAAFLEVRQDSIAVGIGYDAAMVSIDLALLYAQQGRHRELAALAEEMLPIFQSQDVHREAMAALILFQEAARQQTVSASMARELLDYLDRARQDPTLKYREPS